MWLRVAAKKAVCKIYNRIHRVRPPAGILGTSLELREIEERSRSNATDISDHLVTLFAEATAAHPKLIVELGVRGGDSTFALERAAKRCDAYLLSIDMEECRVQVSHAKWSFVRRDDVTFAAEFADWCSSHSLAPAVDVLFIDTSHLYEHTREELRVWLPHLSPKGKLILHDTNMKRFYRRADRSLGPGWNNARGVIRAVEAMVDASFNEERDFVTLAGGWIIRHWAHCSGLTVLERY